MTSTHPTPDEHGTDPRTTMDTLDEPDEVTSALGDLTTDAPPTLLDRIVARRITIPNPLLAPDDTTPDPDHPADSLEGALTHLQVAYTDHGVAFLRAGDDPEAFAADFRARFARPLLPAQTPPTGLLPALRTGKLGRLRLDLRGLSDFEAAVLQAAATIPRGQTRPYAWIAARAGRPKAVRAVGSALGRNPVPLLIPCHRVTRSDGTPGQYIFGAQAKQRLLRAENVDLDQIADLTRRGVHFVASDTTGIVCYPTCHHARRITQPHRRGFASLNAARAAGYRPCLTCRPTALGQPA